jgi:hypothetical protein
MSVWVGFSSSSRFSTLFAARVVAVSTSRAPADSGTRDAHTPHARVFQSDGVPSGPSPRLSSTATGRWHFGHTSPVSWGESGIDVG